MGVIALVALRVFGIVISYGLALAALMCLAGLATLFRLAAYGPRSAEEQEHRVPAAGIGVGSVLLGIAWAVPNEPASISLQVLAVVVMLATRRGWLTGR